MGEQDEVKEKGKCEREEVSVWGVLTGKSLPLKHTFQNQRPSSRATFSSTGAGSTTAPLSCEIVLFHRQSMDKGDLSPKIAYWGNWAQVQWSVVLVQTNAKPACSVFMSGWIWVMICVKMTEGLSLSMLHVCIEWTCFSKVNAWFST